MSSSPEDLVRPAKEKSAADPNGLSSKRHVESPGKEHELQRSRLQQFICELLIRNQQLRIALMEIKARQTEDDGSGNV